MRRLVITENHGLYKVEADGWTSTGASLDSALYKAYAKALAAPGSPVPLSREPAMEDLSTVDVLIVLLGRGRQRSQIHTGIESA
jgi:hypothetical protein